jgi:hypothetical protein
MHITQAHSLTPFNRSLLSSLIWISPAEIVLSRDTSALKEMLSLMGGRSSDELGLFCRWTFDLYCLIRSRLFRDWLDPHGAPDFSHYVCASICVAQDN